MSALAGLRRSLLWRLTRLRRALSSVEEVLFWVSLAEDAPWYPDVGRLEEIGQTVGLPGRRATRDDLELFRAYHRGFGRKLRRGRIRMLERRWAQGDLCYIALDRRGEIVAQLWMALTRCEVAGRTRAVEPNEVYLYGVDTRPDRRGSLGVVACTCAAIREGLELTPRRDRIVSWATPQTFAQFQRLYTWIGLGKPIPTRLERWRRVCGLRFCRSSELPEDWSPPKPPRRRG